MNAPENSPPACGRGWGWVCQSNHPQPLTSAHPTRLNSLTLIKASLPLPLAGGGLGHNNANCASGIPIGSASNRLHPTGPNRSKG